MYWVYYKGAGGGGLSLGWKSHPKQPREKTVEAVTYHRPLLQPILGSPHPHLSCAGLPVKRQRVVLWNVVCRVRHVRVRKCCPGAAEWLKPPWPQSADRVQASGWHLFAKWLIWRRQEAAAQIRAKGRGNKRNVHAGGCVPRQPEPWLDTRKPTSADASRGCFDGRGATPAASPVVPQATLCTPIHRGRSAGFVPMIDRRLMCNPPSAALLLPCPWPVVARAKARPRPNATRGDGGKGGRRRDDAGCRGARRRC